MEKELDIFSKNKSKRKSKKKISIIADHREKNSLVISELESLDINVKLKHLKVADFIVKNVAIERKTINDFISSMINKRLIRQLNEIKQYPNYLLLIEGLDENDLYDNKINVHPNAIRGFLLSILLEFQVPIIFTKNAEDTAKFIQILAKKQKKEISLRPSKIAKSKNQQLQFILEGFPGIGPKTAKKLLSHYKTIQNIINAPINDIKNLIGKKAEIFKIVKKKY